MHIPEDHPIQKYAHTRAFKQLNKYADYMELSDAMRLDFYEAYLRNFKAAAEQEGGWHDYDKRYAKPNVYLEINQSFIWEHTPEGHEFWSIISSGRDFERVFNITIGRREEDDDDF